MTLIHMIRSVLCNGHRLAALAMAGVLLPFASSATAAEEEVVEELAEITVQGDRMNVMQTEPVDSVFGFGKKVDETPRAMTTISNELLEQTIITEIDDLVAMTPGSFTQSFFGVAGSLDVRGTPGENYFRGVKRIDNPGNYPTVIGASDRIDIVRGPASPIYGPSKIGGYLNFVPKSARASNGRYLGETTGAVGLTTGSYGKRVLNGEIGGPLSFGAREGGYYLYAESENSDSYYQNTGTQQSILQGSVDFQLSDSWRTEIGGMYQYFKGNQVAGWNRLTQELIDDGIYITGSPPSLDTNGDGILSDAESIAGSIGTGPNFYDPTSPFVANTPEALQDLVASNPNLALVNPGTTKLKRNQVLVQEDDNLSDHVVTLYFDLIGELGPGLTLTNKMYFESLENNNENAYGFSQYADTYAIEDQLNLAWSPGLEGPVALNLQGGVSLRYQDFEHGDNFDYEFFDRRDLSLGSLGGSAIDRRGMATRGQENYSGHTRGNFKDWGVSFLADLTFFGRLNLLAGARYDYVDMNSRALPDANIITAPDFLGGLLALYGETAFRGNDEGFSWTGSLSYELPYGIRPYVTMARQSTMLLGQGGQIDPGQLASDEVITPSELTEYGIKATMLENRLFIAVDYYKQTRTDFSSQDIVTNAATRTKGYEAELRWVAAPWLTVTGAYSNLKVVNRNAQESGIQFSFLGGEDLLALGVAPEDTYGGAIGASILTTDGRKGGIPENIYSLNLLFGLDELTPGLSSTLSVTSVDSVYSGYSKSVKLPAYTLLNAGVRYAKGSWALGLQGKNLTDERYFRSNFPDLFGSSVVLPEMPRTFLVTVDYKF